MSKAEILAALPQLSPQDRAEILHQLWRMEETAEPSATEKALLDEAQTGYDAAPSEASPWREVHARLRRQ